MFTMYTVFNSLFELALRFIIMGNVTTVNSL